MENMKLTLDSLVSRNDDMVAGAVGDDVMVMSVETGRYYQVNPVGGEILDLLQEPMTVEELCTRLESRFSVGRDELERDVITFLGELHCRKIVTVT